jgi:beta-galactosidase
MHRIVPAFVVAWLLSCTPCWSGDNLDLAELEVDHALTLDFATPHTDWAQPYASGKLRVLFFTSGMGTHPRECVELLQRFDLEAKAVFWSQIVDSTRTHWHGGETGLQRMLHLLEQKWDAFVFMNLPLASLPPQQQYLLLKAVSEGAGLVLVGTDDSRVLKEKNRLNELPPLLAAGPVGDAYRVGKGRGLRLPHRPDIAYHEGWQVEDDYWHERLGRGLLWAAGKEPRLNLALTVSQPEIAATDSGQKLTLRLAGQPIGQKLTLELRLRRPGEEPFPWPNQEVFLDKPLEITLPRLAAGDYHADARILGPAGVETWATVPFRVTSARKVAAVTLAKDWGEIGEHLAGTITLDGPPAAQETVRLRLLDRRRRELVRQDLKPADGQAAFDVTIQPWMPMLLTVEAQVLDGNQELSRAYQYFHVTKRNRDRFNFLMWDTPQGALAPYAEESLAQTGMTLQLQAAPTPPPYVAAFDVAYVPYATRIVAPKSPQGIMLPFCWNDEQAVSKCVSDLARKYIPSRQHGVFAYSLGDENDTRGGCLSPHCARAYREYLKEVYGNLESLNKSWGTSFKAWDDVGLSKEGDNEEENALAQKNYPRWFDRQAFKSYNYVKYCQKYARAFAAIDPEAKTGFEGAGTFAHGDDLDLIVRSLEFWSPYPGMADEVIRSIAPRAMPHGNWMGYTKDADSLLAKYWRMVTRGMDAVWWWRWDCIGQFHGWLAPDLRPYPAVQEILEDTQIVRDGLGDLLLRSTMEDDGVAMLYSYPSVFAHRLAEGGGYGDYESGHLRLQQSLGSLGVSFRYVTDRMLRLGEFKPDRTKVLILCRAEAMSDREAEVIRQFVEKGGTVMADVRPGIYDEHCKPRQRGVLDDLFGISREGPAAAKTAMLRVKQGAASGAELAKIMVDPSIKLAAATASSRAEADGTPAWIVNPVGKGKAVLLNLAAASYPKPGAADTPKQAPAMFEEWLAEAGVTPVVRVTTASGDPLPNVQVIRWNDGGLDIVALFREGGRAEDAVVRLAGGPRYVYDLRNRKPLGQVAQIATTVLPSRASFFVLANRPAARVQLALEPASAQRGTLVRGTLSVPEAEGLHAFRIRARLGDRRLEWVAQNLVVGQQPQPFELPIAYNDPAGEYEITAVDLFTEAATTVKLPVR